MLRLNNQLFWDCILWLFTSLCLWKCFELFVCFYACCPLKFLTTNNLSSRHKPILLELYFLLSNDNINIPTSSQIFSAIIGSHCYVKSLTASFNPSWLEWNNKDFRASNVTSKSFLLISVSSAANCIAFFNKVSIIDG